CDPDTTASSDTDSLYCGLIDNKTSWLPQPIPTCNRHCYLFTVDHGDVVLMHKPNTPSQRFIPITSENYPQLESIGNALTSSDGIILPGSRVRHGAQLNVTCHRGYQLVKTDQPVTTCMDGVWSVRSKCVPASCRTRPPPAPGARVRFYSLKHEAKGRYECFVGHTLRVDETKQIVQPLNAVGSNDDPLGVIRCLYGEWVGIPVFCEPVTCSKLILHKLVQVELKHPTSRSILMGGAATLEETPRQGTVAHFRCSPGFHVVGTTFSVCHNVQRHHCIDESVISPIFSVKLSTPTFSDHRHTDFKSEDDNDGDDMFNEEHQEGGFHCVMDSNKATEGQTKVSTCDFTVQRIFNLKDEWVRRQMEAMSEEKKHEILDTAYIEYKLIGAQKIRISSNMYLSPDDVELTFGEEFEKQGVDGTIVKIRRNESQEIKHSPSFEDMIGTNSTIVKFLGLLNSKTKVVYASKCTADHIQRVHNRTCRGRIAVMPEDCSASLRFWQHSTDKFRTAQWHLAPNIRSTASSPGIHRLESEAIKFFDIAEAILVRFGLNMGRKDHQPTTGFQSNSFDTNCQIALLEQRIHVQEMTLEASYKACDKMNERIRALTEKVAEREDLLSCLMTETWKLKHCYDELLAEHQRLQSVHTDLEMELQSVRKTHEKAMDKLKGELEEKTVTVESLQAEQENIKQDHEQMKERDSRLLKEISTFRERLDEQIGYAKQLEAELARSRSTNGQLEAGLQEMLERSAAHNHVHEQEKTVLEESKQVALTAAKSEIQQLQKSVDSKSQEVLAMAAELSHARQKITDYQDCELQAHSLSVLKSEHKIAISSYEDRLSHLQMTNENHNQEMSCLKRNISRLQEQLTQERTLCESLKADLDTSRNMLVSAREELMKRSEKEEGLEQCLGHLRSKLDEAVLHRTAAEKAHASVKEEVQNLELHLDRLQSQETSMQSRIKELEAQSELDRKAKTQMQEQLIGVSDAFRTLEKDNEEKRKKVNKQYEGYVAGIQIEMKRTQSSLEQTTRKIQKLAGELRMTEEARRKLANELAFQESKHIEMKKTFAEYQSLHRTPETTVSFILFDMPIELSMYTNQNGSAVFETLHFLSVTPMCFIGARINQLIAELDELRKRLNETQAALDKAEQEVAKLRTETGEVQEELHRKNQSNAELYADLAGKKEALKETKLELKKAKRVSEQTEMMYQELELSVQQLTRQLEQSESLRNASEQASNLATAEASSSRIELAKQTETVQRLQKLLDAANQRVVSLEADISNKEVELKERIQEVENRIAIIRQLELEKSHLKQSCTELEGEVNMLRDKLSSVNSELIKTQENLEQFRSERDDEDTSRDRMKLELKNLRETHSVLAEESTQREVQVEMLQQRISENQTKVRELTSLLSEREEILEKLRNDLQTISREKDAISGRLRERESAATTLKRDLETSKLRTDSLAEILTNKEAELIELRRKLELSEKRLDKCKEENNQHTARLSLLENQVNTRTQELQQTRVIEKTSFVEPSLDRIRSVQLMEQVKDLRQQLMEYKTTSMTFKTERAHLQELVNHLQGELAARADELRQSKLEIDRMRRQHESDLETTQSSLHEKLQQTEDKLNEANTKVKQLEAELEVCKLNGGQYLNSESKSEEHTMLQRAVEALEREKKTLWNLLDETRNERNSLREQLSRLRESFEEEVEKHKKTKVALESKLDQKVEELAQLLQNQTSSVKSDRYSQDSCEANSKPIEQTAMKLMSDSDEWTGSEELTRYSPQYFRRSWTRKYTNLTADPRLESRVASLKIANQRLRAEVEAACDAVRTVAGKMQFDDEVTRDPGDPRTSIVQDMTPAGGGSVNRDVPETQLVFVSTIEFVRVPTMD
ncbi:hypothetical protein CLF_110274, partial [Clonorchis sinensis]